MATPTRRHVCSVCFYCALSHRALLKHYSLIHEHETGFSIVCGVEDCQKRYKSVRCLKRHLGKKHRLQHEAEAEVQALTDDAMSLDDEPPSKETECTKHEIASLILRFRENSKMPYKTCDTVLESIGTVLVKKDDVIKSKLKSLLAKENLDISATERVSNALQEECCQINDIIAELSDHRTLNNYVETNMPMTEPVEYVLGEPSKANKKTDTMQYVPLLDILENLLKNEDTFAEIMQHTEHTDGKLRDLSDGAHFQNHRFWSANESALQIILYFDEFTAVNPIGPHAKKYKFAAFYFSLGNINIKLRSQLQSIHLLCLADSHLLQKHGLSVVLKPLLDDLKKLEEEGITIQRPEGNFQFYGSLLVAVADNLGSHMLGCYTQSFSAHRCCRFCFIQRQDLRTSTDPSVFQQRTVAGYEEQSVLVTQDPTFSSIYGLKGQSPLNRLSYFHVVDGLPPDIMHDLFESGVVSTTLEAVVAHYIAKGIFSVNYIEGRIEKFPYAKCDKTNKPDASSCVTGSTFRVKLKASQVWCLLRLFPLLVGHAVDEEDPAWEVVLALVEMVDTIMSPVLSHATIAFMNDKIQHFYSVRKQVFPEMLLKPKDHFTLHYPEMARKFGPLRGSWSMRFEAKHSFFKNVSRRTQNKKNLCLTMARRHQYQACVNLLSNAGFRAHYDMAGGSVVEASILPVPEQALIRPLLGNTDSVYSCQSVSVNGTKYGIETVVVAGIRNESPLFAVVKKCFVVGDIPYLMCCIHDTYEFLRHFHAYCLKETLEHRMFKISELFDWHPLSFYILKGYKAVVLHHFIDVD